MANLIPLLGWNRILTGNRGVDPDGTDFVMEAPGGVRLEIETARKSAPILRPETPWENACLGFAQVMKVGGTFRMWYSAGNPIALCHAESDDAFTWRRPNLGLTEFGGNIANNLCTPVKGFQGAGIFIDPSAAVDARFKMIYQSLLWYDGQGNAIPQDEGEKRWRDGKGGFKYEGVLNGAVSPDGLKWRELPQPLVKYFCDTQNVGVYDAARRRYVGFVRAHGARGRAIGLIEAQDFQTWPEPRIILQPDPDDPPDVDFYSNAYSPYPDADGVHVMFPGVYHHTEDRVDGRLAAAFSWENWAHVGPQFSWENWAWVERRAIVPAGLPGSPDGGSIYPCPGLLRLPDGHMGVLCWAGPRRHNDRESSLGGFLTWALWQRDRLAGVRAEKDGQFTINLPLSGGPIRMNYRTEAGGWIKAELIHSQVHNPARRVSAFPGYAFDDCEELAGDKLDRPLAWKGQSALPTGISEIMVRVRMHRSKIFAFMT